MDNISVNVNFFPLNNQIFEFTVYIKKCTSNLQRCDSFSFEVKQFNLPANNSTNYEHYFVTFENSVGFIEKKVKSTDNNWLTIWFLFKQLCRYVKENPSIDATYTNNYEKCVDVTVKTTELGNETISIIPINLNTQFGFLIDFHFRKNDDLPFTREVQKLSLSLDTLGKPNKNYYSDKYNKIETFINSSLFDLKNSLEDVQKCAILPNMVSFKSKRLAAKKYVFGGENIDISQFKGIEKNGPYQSYSENPILCFVYRNQDKDLSHTLYYALLGKTYPTFKGMGKMFGFAMNRNTVIGISINDFSESEILNLITKIKNQSAGRRVIPIVVVPWTKDTACEEESKIYYIMKHHFLKESIASQFVGISRINNYENLKWSVSSIGLQIFTKLGGSPWCMVAETNKCLIIGIGQSHKKNNTKKIEKYFSYSIMTDASGLFKNIKVLSENTDQAEYLNGLASQLNNLIRSESKKYDNIVIHTSFRLRDKEISKINNVVKELSDNLQKEIVVIRFSSKHNYMGFDLLSNSKMPVESTSIRLNQREYLVWFEGLSSVTQTVKTRIGPPMHLTVDFAKSYQYEDIYTYLQDAINLSGANWRGFNAKTTPISVLYARLLSSFLEAFDRYNLEKIDIEQLTPWFL